MEIPCTIAYPTQDTRMEAARVRQEKDSDIRIMSKEEQEI